MLYSIYHVEHDIRDLAERFFRQLFATCLCSKIGETNGKPTC